MNLKMDSSLLSAKLVLDRSVQNILFLGIPASLAFGFVLPSSFKSSVHINGASGLEQFT